MKRLCAILLALTWAPATMAGYPSGNKKPNYSLAVNAADGSSFSAEDMTNPAQTHVIPVRGMTWVTFYLSVAAVAGTADVTVSCNSGPSSTDVNYPLQSESVASGVATFSDYVPTKSVTTSGKWPVTISVLNKDFIQCTFTCASGTVDVTARAW